MVIDTCQSFYLKKKTIIMTGKNVVKGRGRGG